MSRRNTIIVFVVLAAVAWLFLREDPEADVRKAHQELVRLLSKTGSEGTATMLADARILRGLFADTCMVTGDAEMLVGSYTPEEMVSTAIQVQGMFLSIELTFHDLVIEFPSKENALVNFTALLVGRSKIEGEEAAAETREVVSRLQNVDGKWLFTEFKLTLVSENK